MNGREFWELRDISDDNLEASLSRLLGAGARLEARIVAHLAEVDARRLHLMLGCSSLYDYCRKRLGLSDYEAFARIAAARAARKYPLVFEMLERRELHLTAICEIREFLSAANHRDLLAEVSGKTKLQIREILAQRFPQADLPSNLKKLPTLEPLSPGRYRLLVAFSAQQKQKLELAGDLLSHANPSGDLTIVLERALDELISRLEKRRFGQLKPRNVEGQQVTMSRRLRSKTHATESEAPIAQVAPIEHAVPIEHAAPIAQVVPIEHAAPIEHAVPIAQVVPIEHAAPIEHAVPIAQVVPIEHAAPIARGERIEPREQVDFAGSTCQKARERAHIPRATRRQLLERDGCGCAFVGSDGQRCETRAFLQFHHRRAWAWGGPDSADNLQLLCRAHNRLLAEQDFGSAHVERAIASKTQRSERTGD